MSRPRKTKSPCECCGAEASAAVGACLSCIRSVPERALDVARERHERWRSQAGDVPRVPKGGAVRCGLCVNGCEIKEGERGFCRARRAEGGRLVEEGRVSWYYDPLPTNCVADWVCPGGTGAGAGHPRYARAEGWKNLAVFYCSCSYDCLFCQNWHFRNAGAVRAPEELSAAADERTSCICYFGGDPSTQARHAIQASKLALEATDGRVRICWETNGSASAGVMKEMLELSLKSGGIVKFDLKAFDRNLNLALCGVSNEQTLENFCACASRAHERPEVPLVVASTPLVTGYIDPEEVGKIARFIASVDATTPYSLLAFHPDYLMTDVPPTPRALAEACAEEAKSAGLLQVRIGNVHLLW